MVGRFSRNGFKGTDDRTTTSPHFIRTHHSAPRYMQDGLVKCQTTSPIILVQEDVTSLFKQRAQKYCQTKTSISRFISGPHGPGGTEFLSECDKAMSTSPSPRQGPKFPTLTDPSSRSGSSSRCPAHHHYHASQLTRPCPQGHPAARGCTSRSPRTTIVSSSLDARRASTWGQLSNGEKGDRERGMGEETQIQQIHRISRSVIESRPTRASCCEINAE